MRSVSAARAAARAESKRPPNRARVGMCLKTTRRFYEPDVPVGQGNAAAAFAQTRQRGRGPAPAGAIHWWTGGAQGNGHVVLGESPTKVWTIDNVREGGVDLVTLARIERTWPALRYAGWTRDINGVTVVPLIQLDEVMTHQSMVRAVARALVEEHVLAPEHIGADAWTVEVLTAYAEWQAKAGFGPATPGKAGPSDGRPGLRSLTALGLRRGFVVR